MIELIMVLVVLAILALVLAPRAQVLERVRLDQTAMEIMSHLRYVQRLAQTRHKRFGVQFFADPDRYEVFEGDDTGDLISDPRDPGEFQMDVNERVFSGDKLNMDASFDGSAILKFNYRGEPLSGDTDDTLVNPGSVTISSPQESKTIWVDPGTGRVHE